MGASGGSPRGSISTGNTSTALLNAAQVFTGQWEEVTDFAYFSVSIISDVSSATNGLEFQWSSDAINIDRNEQTQLTGGSQGRAFALVPRARFFRIKYANGGANQTIFRLQTVYHVIGTGHITKSLKQLVTEENFAWVTQSPIMARKSDGTYLNIAGLDLTQAALLGTVEAFPMLCHLGYGFGLSTDTVSTGGTNERAMILIDNPNGNTKIMHIESILFGLPENGVVFYKMYMNPTVTANGAALTPVGKRQSSQQSATVNWYSIPTVSAFGARFFTCRADQSSAQVQQDWNLGQHLEPNNKILITAIQSLSGNGGNITCDYVEI